MAAVVILLAGVEAITVAGFDRVSRVQQHEVSQRQALLKVDDSAHNAATHVAVLGNSLLLEGVDVPLLQSKLEPRSVPVPYFVLATTYYDWYFGLKRLFAEGVRPRYVVVGLSPNQFASSRTRGDYSARYLFQAGDLLAVARLTHMNATAATGFLLSHYSKFYSTRTVTRGFVLGRVLPSVDTMLHNLSGGGREADIPDETLRQVASDRLLALDQLCRENGVHLVFAIPPTYQKGATTIAEVGRLHHIPVIVPVADGEFDGTYYQPDGFHLNQRGAKIFTARLASRLLTEFAN